MRRGTSTDVGEGRLRRRHTHLLAPVDPGQSSIHTEPCLGAGSQHARVCRWPAGWKTQSKRPPPPSGPRFSICKMPAVIVYSILWELPYPHPPQKRQRNSPSSYAVSSITVPSAERKGRMFWGAESLLGWGCSPQSGTCGGTWSLRD